MQDPRLDRGKQLGSIHRVVRWRHLPMRLEQLLGLLFDPDGFDRLLEQFDRGAVLLGRAVELLCVLQWRQAGEVDDDIVCQLWRRLGGRTRGIRLGTGIRKAVGIVRHREIPFREFGGLAIVVERSAFVVGLWLNDPGGNHHLERGDDQARPVGASTSGLGGQLFAVADGGASRGAAM